MPPLRPASDTVMPRRTAPSSGSPRRASFSSSAIVSPSRHLHGALPFAAPVAGAHVPLTTTTAGLPLLDELTDLVAALAADLLVEGRPPLGLDRLAALLANLLVEARPALGLDGVAALLADLLVELAAPLGLDRLAA